MKEIYMLLKKAAMFGLDARIALAIFGALSVISGAALYNVIQNVKVTTYLNEFNELGKASDQYFLDTGSLIKSSPNQGAHSETYNLINNVNNVKNWKGPYLDPNVYVSGEDSNGKWLKRKDNNRLRIIVYRNSKYENCTVNDCYIWSRVDIDKDQLGLIKKIDLAVDSIADPSNGKLIYTNYGGIYGVFYKYAPINYNLIN